MLQIKRHTRDILDMRADARMLDLANRFEPADTPEPAPSLVDAYRIAVARLDASAAQRAADVWYAQRPAALGGGRPDAYTGTDQ